MKISAVIIAGNEEEKIADAVRSLDWCDEVLVVDSESVDRTREIAACLGARVLTRPWSGFADQKQFATDSATYDWIFSLDADECVSSELKDEILGLRDEDEAGLPRGFRIPRLSYYMGRPVHHSGWYPDWQLRLFDRRAGRWSNDLVHESFRLRDSKAGKLRSNILHFTVDSVAEHRRMIDERYAPLAARQMFQRGRQTSRLRMISAGPIAFFSTYVLKAGFLDGLVGLRIARLAAYHASLKQRLLSELQCGDPQPRRTT